MYNITQAQIYPRFYITYVLCALRYTHTYYTYKNKNTSDLCNNDNEKK